MAASAFANKCHAFCTTPFAYTQKKQAPTDRQPPSQRGDEVYDGGI